MRALNMAAITASLERSFKNCSLEHRRHHRNRGAEVDEEEEEEEEDEAEQVSGGRTSISDDNNLPSFASDTALELNSHAALPYSWEQCLDLKTGEIYYINWRTGMRATEDPRTMNSGGGSGQHDGGTDMYSEDDGGDSSCESEESSSEYSSPPSSSTKEREYSGGSHRGEKDRENVLVVAGCKSCLMYFMVPKQVEDCPKCTGQLLHFDRPDHNSSS